MKKFILPLICSSVVLLSACGSISSPKGNVDSSATQTTTEAVSTGTWASVVSSGSTAPLSKDTQAIIKIQLKTPDAILGLDCNTYDTEGKAYCTNEKAKMEKARNEVTWQKVLAKGDGYIKTFDCTTITSSFGQKYCKEYQEKWAK